MEEDLARLRALAEQVSQFATHFSETNCKRCDCNQLLLFRLLSNSMYEKHAGHSLRVNAKVSLRSVCRCAADKVVARRRRIKKHLHGAG